MKHKHAELIKQWADGAEIEYKDYDGGWYVINSPAWHDHTEYRIKLEPIAIDLVDYLYVRKGTIFFHKGSDANLRIIFDGESGNLKGAEVIK
jgi:hypothetical protein